MNEDLDIVRFEKLDQGGKDVEAMKIVLNDKSIELAAASEATQKMLGDLEISSLAAAKNKEKVDAVGEGRAIEVHVVVLLVLPGA